MEGKIKLTKKELNELIEHYYLTYEELKVKANTLIKSECVGVYESTQAVLTVEVSMPLEVAGINISFTNELPENEVLEKLKVVLKEKNVEFNNISFDYGFKQEYDMRGDSYGTSYFNGIIISMNKCQIKKYLK